MIGIWHGASFKYIVFGIWNGTIITSSLLLEEKFSFIRKKINGKIWSGFYKIFQIARTSFIVLIGRYITRAPRFLVGVEMLKTTFTNFKISSLCDGSMLNLGIELKDFIIIGVGTLILLIIEGFEEKNRSLYEWKEKKGFIVQIGIIMVSLICLLFFGVLRGNYISADFIYKNF